VTDEDWTAVVRWLNDLGLRVVAIYSDKGQVLIQLPEQRN
jgi:hypothetical protein